MANKALEHESQRVVFDFDGTIAHRPGMWSQALLDVLDAQVDGHVATLDGLGTASDPHAPWSDEDIN